jgi:inositol oxygenase
MSVWEALEMLNTLVDESDPDTSVGQIEHLLQTAEAIRRDGKPDWMQLTGLIHDLGKLLCFFGAEGQWDVVGDTFVVGCKFPREIIYPDTFAANPDSHDPKLQTELGIYEPHCGLDNAILSWGHDQYIYEICKAQSTRKYFRPADEWVVLKISPQSRSLHAPVSLLLPMAPRRRISPPHERRGRGAAQGCQRLQP